MHLLLVLLCCLHITASTRHLKMAPRYHSHPSLITYEMRNYCDKFIDLSAEGRSSGGILKQNTLFEDALSNFSCSTTLRAPENYTLQVSLTKIEIFRRGNTCSDYMRIFEGGLNSTDPLTHKICGYYDEKHEKPMVYRSRSMLTIRSFRGVCEDYIYNYGFTLTTTVVSQSQSGICLGNEQMLCDNGFCVWKHFQCNGYNNCGDGSDEKDCAIDTVMELSDRSNLRFPAVLGAALIVGILVIMIIATLVILFHKKPPACCSCLFPVTQGNRRRPVRTVASTLDSRNQTASHGYENGAFLDDLPPTYEMVTAPTDIQHQNENVNDLPDYQSACKALRCETSNASLLQNELSTREQVLLDKL